MKDNEKIDIELYQSLKNKAYQLFKSIKDKKNLSLSEIESILEIYDIDPIINEFYLQKCLECCLENLNKNVNEILDEKKMEVEISDENIKEFSQKYIHYINSLSLSQKIHLNKKIETTTEIYNYMKCYINNDSNIKKIYQIFQYIYDNDNNYNMDELKSLFYSKYFVDIEKFHIPLIYGTIELRYSAIINDIKSFLFDNQMLSHKSFLENRYNKVKNYVKNIIKKKTNEEMSHHSTSQDKKNIIEDSPHKDTDSVYKKLEFLYDFIEIIFDSENKTLFDCKCNFQNDDLNAFSDNYILNDNIDFVYYNFLYIDLLMYCYLYFPQEIEDTNNQYLKLFESYEEKKNFLQKKLNKKKKLLEIINFKEEKNDYEKIKIKYFNQNNKKEYFEFNPYEYVIQNIKFSLRYDDFKKQFEKEKNFSLYKFYKDNQMFNNDTLNNEYKNNIHNMLVSNITNKAFDKFSIYHKFNNPFKEENKEFIEQINRVKFYIYFPLSKFGGLTFKKIGIIFINKAFKKISTTDMKIKLIKSIINISDKKITEYHEILAHYTTVLCRATSKDVELKTPDNTFVEETSDDENYNSNYDCGDKLESLLFGNKIAYLTIQAAIFIISEKNWKSNDVDDFRNQFINKNELKNEDINLSHENNLIKAIINYTNLKDIEIISVNQINSFIVFRKAISFGTIDNNIIYDSGEDEEECFSKFSITSNAFLPREVSITKIIEEFGPGP